LQGAAPLAHAVQADRGNDNDRLALLVAPHDLPDAAHPLLEAVEALVAFLVAELCQRWPWRRSGSHEMTLAESGPARRVGRWGAGGPCVGVDARRGRAAAGAGHRRAR